MTIAFLLIAELVFVGWQIALAAMQIKIEFKSSQKVA